MLLGGLSKEHELAYFNRTTLVDPLKQAGGRNRENRMTDTGDYNNPGE